MRRSLAALKVDPAMIVQRRLPWQAGKSTQMRDTVDGMHHLETMGNRKPSFVGMCRKLESLHGFLGAMDFVDLARSRHCQAPRLVPMPPTPVRRESWDVAKDGPGIQPLAALVGLSQSRRLTRLTLDSGNKLVPKWARQKMKVLRPKSVVSLAHSAGSTVRIAWRDDCFTVQP